MQPRRDPTLDGQGQRTLAGALACVLLVVVPIVAMDYPMQTLGALATIGSVALLRSRVGPLGRWASRGVRAAPRRAVSWATADAPRAYDPLTDEL